MEDVAGSGATGGDEHTVVCDGMVRQQGSGKPESTVKRGMERGKRVMKKTCLKGNFLQTPFWPKVVVFHERTALAPRPNTTMA